MNAEGPPRASASLGHDTPETARAADTSQGARRWPNAALAWKFGLDDGPGQGRCRDVASSTGTGTGTGGGGGGGRVMARTPRGVRDDIDAYIAALPITDLQRKAVMQRARVQQAKLLLDPMDRQAVVASSERSMAAAHCMWDRFNRSDNISTRIEAITANTPKRAKRYLHYMAALGGTSVSGASGDTCEP